MTAEIINHRNFWKDIGLYAIFLSIPNVFGGGIASVFISQNNVASVFVSKDQPFCILIMK